MNSIVQSAMIFADRSHAGQKYGKIPFISHPEQVVNVLKEHGFGEDSYVLSAAWLHDVMEDAGVTFETLLSEFGKNIARMVYAVTDEPGADRKEKKTRTYPKILAAGREATAVKLADRIANVSYGLKGNHPRFEKYKLEHPEFKQKLHIPGELKSLWATLDVLMAREIEE